MVLGDRLHGYGAGGLGSRVEATTAAVRAGYWNDGARPPRNDGAFTVPPGGPARALFAASCTTRVAWRAHVLASSRRRASCSASCPVSARPVRCCTGASVRRCSPPRSSARSPSSDFSSHALELRDAIRVAPASTFEARWPTKSPSARSTTTGRASSLELDGQAPQVPSCSRRTGCSVPACISPAASHRRRERGQAELYGLNPLTTFSLRGVAHVRPTQ